MTKLITYDTIEDAILGTVDMAVWTKSQYTLGSMNRRYYNFLDNYLKAEFSAWYEKYGWAPREIGPVLTQVFAHRIRQLPDDVLVTKFQGRQSAFDDECEVFAAMCLILAI